MNIDVTKFSKEFQVEYENSEDFFHSAIYANDPVAMRTFISTLDKGYIFDREESLEITFASVGMLGMMRDLGCKISDPEFMNAQGRDADCDPIWVMLNGDDEDKRKLKLLIEMGMDIDYTTDNGETFTHLAVRNNNPHLIKKLSDLGADMESVDHSQTGEGLTPMKLSIKEGTWRCIIALHECGVKIKQEHIDYAENILKHHPQFGWGFSSEDVIDTLNKYV